MKNLLKLTTIIMLAAGLSSCEKIKSLFDVEFESELSGNLLVNVAELQKKSTDAYSFSASATIDPLSDEDIEEYVDNIKEIDVDGIIAEVTSVNKDNVVFKAGTFFTIKDDMNVVTWTLSSDWPIVVGTTLALEDLGGVYDAVSEILDRKEVFEIGVEGECSETGVSIVISLGINSTITATPL
jgi:hypothetical protein